MEAVERQLSAALLEEQTQCSRVQVRRQKMPAKPSSRQRTCSAPSRVGSPSLAAQTTQTAPLKEVAQQSTADRAVSRLFHSPFGLRPYSWVSPASLPCSRAPVPPAAPECPAPSPYRVDNARQVLSPWLPRGCNPHPGQTPCA